MHIKFPLIALAAILAGCAPPKHPHAISQAQADALAAEAAEEFRNVNFDDNYVLLGGVGRKGGAGYELELAWKSGKKQKMEHLVVVHAVDATGKILGQADYPQSKEKAAVAAGAIWRDVVTIPYEKLQGATAIGIGLMADGKQWLLAESGPRDWDDRRLLFPLPDDLPAKASNFTGYLEAANGKAIAGWVKNRDSATTRVEVEIFDGAKSLAKVVADSAREDLARGKIGDGKYGFIFPTPAELKDGKPHEIHVKVLGEDFELTNSPKTMTAK